MDFTIFNNMKFKIIILVLLGSNCLFITSGQSLSYNYIQSSKQITSINQNEFVGENFTYDLLQDLAYIFYKGDGTGIIEVIFNLMPIVGNNNSNNALLYPIFLLLFTGGVYFGLKKQRLIS